MTALPHADGTETVLITAGARVPEAAVQNVARHPVKTYKADLILTCSASSTLQGNFEPPRLNAKTLQQSD